MEQISSVPETYKDALQALLKEIIRMRQLLAATEGELIAMRIRNTLLQNDFCEARDQLGVLKARHEELKNITEKRYWQNAEEEDDN